MIEDLAACCDGLADPRATRQCDHRSIDILVSAASAGAESREDVALYGRGRQAWLKRFPDLPNGIPSHDTFRRVLMPIDPDAFEGCFARRVQSVTGKVVRAAVAIDGRTVRRSGNTAAIAARRIRSAPGQAIGDWCPVSARSTTSRTRSPPSPSGATPCISTAPS